MARPKKERNTFETIKWNIEHTKDIKHLERDIVALVEWREVYPRTDKQYRVSKDLLNFAFDKYEDLCNNRGCEAKTTFCGFLNEV